MQSPLSVEIVGGNRATNVSENLYLKANVYDPDDSIEGNIDDLHPFQYTWYCDQLDLTSMYDAIIYPDVAGNIKRTLMIPSTFLQDGKTYFFIVTVCFSLSLINTLQASHSHDWILKLCGI